MDYYQVCGTVNHDFFGFLDWIFVRAQGFEGCWGWFSLLVCVDVCFAGECRFRNCSAVRHSCFDTITDFSVSSSSNCIDHQQEHQHQHHHQYQKLSNLRPSASRKDGDSSVFS